MGDRSGEALALAVPNLLLEDAAIRIAQSVWHGKIQTVKSRKGNRIVEISPQLVSHLRDYLRTWKPNRLNLLFATNKGTPSESEGCIRFWTNWASSARASMLSGMATPPSWITCEYPWQPDKTAWGNRTLAPQWDTHTL